MFNRCLSEVFRACRRQRCYHEHHHHRLIVEATSGCYCSISFKICSVRGVTDSASLISLKMP